LFFAPARQRQLDALADTIPEELGIILVCTPIRESGDVLLRRPYQKKGLSTGNNVKPHRASAKVGVEIREGPPRTVEGVAVNLHGGWGSAREGLHPADLPNNARGSDPPLYSSVAGTQAEEVESLLSLSTPVLGILLTEDGIWERRR